MRRLRFSLINFLPSLKPKTTAVNQPKDGPRLPFHIGPHQFFMSGNHPQAISVWRRWIAPGLSSVPSSERGFEISYAALSIGNTGHTSANITIIVAERAMGTAQQMDFPMFSIPSLTASVRSILLAISCDRFSASWMLFTLHQGKSEYAL